MLVYHANCYILRSPSLSLLASVAAERGEHTISGYDEGHFFSRATKEFESRKPLWHPFWMGLTCDFLLSGSDHLRNGFLPHRISDVVLTQIRRALHFYRLLFRVTGKKEPFTKCFVCNFHSTKSLVPRTFLMSDEGLKA